LHTRGVSAQLLSVLRYTANAIQCNAQPIWTIETVRAGDILSLLLPEEAPTCEPLAYPLHILYEDYDILVVNKPPTLAMHPTHNHQGDTLANAVTSHLLQRGISVPFRAAGRLDKGTSGIVVCCLHSFAASKLNGNVKKTYFAVAQGILSGSGEFSEAIFRPHANSTLRACRPDGEPLQHGDEPAVTHWKALQSGNDLTLLRITLETGRTHQIRAHFAHHGTPLLGDAYYGGADIPKNHQLLHCGEARFAHPLTGKQMQFLAPMPADMQWYADKIGQSKQA
jgi:23S rRNA pseudouridine1911/1915/1917 synthase